MLLLSLMMIRKSMHINPQPPTVWFTPHLNHVQRAIYDIIIVTKNGKVCPNFLQTHRQTDWQPLLYNRLEDQGASRHSLLATSLPRAFSPRQCKRYCAWQCIQRQMVGGGVGVVWPPHNSSEIPWVNIRALGKRAMCGQKKKETLSLSVQ